MKHSNPLHSAVRKRTAALMALSALVMAQHSVAATPDGVQIRITTDGIPHVRAANWGDLGVGVGYVQAQDALCTLAEAFVTYEGRRAWFFGAEATPARDSTFGRRRNLDLDFFFRAFAEPATLARLRAEQPAGLRALIEGYAEGYNRYLAQARSERGQGAQRACLDEAWVRNITADDLYRRIYAAQVAAGYLRFLPEIVNARPATAATAARDALPLRERLAHRVGEEVGLGSNMLAFGGKATGERGAVLFGNPHWYWGGPDRLYQMHLTIPGRLNVAGATFLGMPVVMIGFNDDVAWTHTVSEARRFGLFELALDPADPTRYRVDGRSEAMTAREVRVEVRGDDGTARSVTRTLYRTRFGPVVDLGGHDAAFGWGRTSAIAIRDVNADNFRVLRHFFHWNQARSLDEFIAIQRREAALPWVNTAAIGRADGRVWYADVGAAPNAPDSLRQSCLTPLAQGFAQLDARTPFLDASRSACDWQTDPRAVQPGAMAAQAMPSLLREDYVANMNDSYWLAQPRQPLEGYPALLGGERRSLTLRGRLGHRIANELGASGAASAAELSRRVRTAVLTPRAYSAEQFKDTLLAQACQQRTVTLPATADAPAAPVDISRACAILQRWSGKADAQDRGVLLWEAFWTVVDQTPDDVLYQVPFSVDAPLDTPSAPRPGPERAAQALAQAVVSLTRQGIALDAPLDSQRFVQSEGRQLPLFGGCHLVGYFTVVCNSDRTNRMGPDALGNSYLQVVHFGPKGVEPYTLLAHGQHEAAVSDGTGAAPVARYTRKDWLRFPFSEEDIARSPGTRTLTLPGLRATAERQD
ncbi:penicillin acylase family protein [Chitiniphilus purpureus]|uniref:Penicillin acylase family protein n=1 Tax=Chitiniphilus purpureus TaxID=2981137 RepID=A0ABY6DMB1_9NEIS|nr:penicillin acylase family protein [Chitiniphilus sp. CD1]UXY15510.1 penicillin acylase family protein [Chitiniphilus sp. CD1]